MSLQRWVHEFRTGRDVIDRFLENISQLRNQVRSAGMDLREEVKPLGFAETKYKAWSKTGNGTPHLFLAPAVNAAAEIAGAFVDGKRCHDAFWVANVFGEMTKILVEINRSRYAPVFESFLTIACRAISYQSLPSQESVGETSLVELCRHLERIADFALGTHFDSERRTFRRQHCPDTVTRQRVLELTLAWHFDAHLTYLLTSARPRVKAYVTSNMPVVYRMKLPEEWAAKRKEWEKALCEAGFEDDLSLLRGLGDLVVAEEVGQVPADQRERMKLAAADNDYGVVVERLRKSAMELRGYLYAEAHRRLNFRPPKWPHVPQEKHAQYTRCKKLASSDDPRKLQEALKILQDIWQADIQNFELRDLVAFLEASTSNTAAAEHKLRQISRKRDASDNFATDWNLAIIACNREEESDAYALLRPLMEHRDADEDLVVVVLALSLKLNDAAGFLEAIPRTMSRRFHPLAIVVAHEQGDEGRVKDLWGELVMQWGRRWELPPVDKRFYSGEFEAIVDEAIVNGQVDQLVAWLGARIKTQGRWIPNHLALARVLETECDDIEGAFDALQQRCRVQQDYRGEDQQRRLSNAFRDLFELCRRNERNDLGEKAYQLADTTAADRDLLDSFKTFAPSGSGPVSPGLIGQDVLRTPTTPVPVPPSIFPGTSEANSFAWVAARLSDVRSVDSYVSSAKAIEEFVKIVSALSPDGGGTVVDLIRNVSEVLTAFSRTKTEDQDARVHLYERAADYETRLRAVISSGALEQRLADVITPYCKSLEQVMGDLTRKAGIGPSLDVSVENPFYSLDAVRSTLAFRLANTSDRPMTDIWGEVLLDSPQLMAVGSREFRIERLRARESVLIPLKLQRNREVPANDTGEITFRISLRASAEGYPDYDLGVKRLQVPARSLKDAIGEDTIPRLFIVGKPLMPSQRVLFQGRDDIMSKFRNSFYGDTQREVYFLDGIRRAGKTSILNFLVDEIPQNIFPVLINLDKFALRPPIDSPMVLRALCLEMAEAASSQGDATVQVPDQETWQATPPQAFSAFLSALREALSGRVPCLMIDEFQDLLLGIGRPGTGHPQDTLILDQLRGHMDESGIYAVFTGSIRFDRLDKLVDHRIFGSLTRLRVSFLSEEGVADVLQSGMGQWVKLPQETVNMVFELTGGYPWLVQTYGGELVDLLNKEQRTVATPEDVCEVTREKVLPNNELFSFWWPTDQLSHAEERFVEWLLKKCPDSGKAVSIREFFAEVPNREQSAFRRALENLRACEVLDSTQTEELRFRGNVLRQWLQNQINDDGQLRVHEEIQHRPVDRGHAGIFVDHENLIHSLQSISTRRGVQVPDNKLEWFRPILDRLIEEAERRIGPLTHKVTVAFWNRPREAELLPAYSSHDFITRLPEEVKLENAVDFKVADEIRRANEQSMKQNTRLGTAILVSGDGDFSHAARALVNDGVALQIWSGSKNANEAYGGIVGVRNVVALDDICGL